MPLFSAPQEPDLWKKPDGKTPLGVTPQTLAGDAVTLKKALAPLNIGKDVYGSSFASVSSQLASDFLPIAAAGDVRGCECVVLRVFGAARNAPPPPSPFPTRARVPRPPPPLLLPPLQTRATTTRTAVTTAS